MPKAVLGLPEKRAGLSESSGNCRNVDEVRCQNPSYECGKKATRYWSDLRVCKQCQDRRRRTGEWARHRPWEIENRKRPPR